jgi:putative membrane protein
MDPGVFPALNAVLNGCACALLLVGFALIRARRERAHRNAMLAAFGCSVLFLASYLWFHFHYQIRVAYAGPDWGRTPYLAMLLAHTVLAALVPFLALRTIWLGLHDRRAAHRRLARVTFPIWLFVSVTGVLIYFVLYQWTGSGEAALAPLRASRGAAG